MSEDFALKLRSAAVAGWWTLLIAVGVFLVQWVVYLFAVRAEPHWVLTLWGPGTDWPQVRVIWFWFLAGFKVLLAAWALLLLWLTLWARRLRAP